MQILFVLNLKTLKKETNLIHLLHIIHCIILDLNWLVNKTRFTQIFDWLPNQVLLLLVSTFKSNTRVVMYKS